LGPAAAGNLSLALTIIGLVAFIAGGISFDKVFKGKWLPIMIIGYILVGVFAYTILLPGVFGNMGLLVICLMIAGFGVPFMMPTLSAYVAMNYPPNMVGTITGWCFGFGTFGGALGLFLGGMSIGATGSFNIAITMISLAAIVGLILSFFLKPRQT